MPHYYDNYEDLYYEEYPPYSSRSRHPFQYPTSQVGPNQHHSRPRRRYSHSQVIDSAAPDNHYPSYITQSRHYGQQQEPMMNYSPQGRRKAVDTYHQSYPPAHSSLHQQQQQQQRQRQDPRMFQDQQYQYDENNDSNRPRRSSTGSTWTSYPMENANYYDYDYDYDDNYDYTTNDNQEQVDSDDDSLNTLEMEALENAKRNVNPSGATPSPFHPENLTIPISAQMEYNTNGTGTRSEQQDTNTNTNTPNITISPPIMSSSGTSSETLTDNKESTKKRRWPLDYLFRKSSTGSNFSKSSYNLFMTTTPSPSNSLTSSSNSSDISNHTNDSQNRHIPLTSSTTTTKQKQKQRESQPSIVSYRNKLEAATATATATTSSSHMDVSSRPFGDAEMTALLDNIWCFKASQVASQLISPDNKSNVWTGFDYKNQEILTNHSIALMKDQSMTDPGLELFDSHIRKGTLPFLVVISQQLAYYPTSNNTIDKIEIKCLPNTKETVLLRKKKLG